MGRWWPATGSGALSAAMPPGDLLKEGYLTLWNLILFSLPRPYFGLRSNNREGTQPCPSTENWIKDLPSEQDRLPLSPSGNFHKPLIFLQQRADRMKTTITEN